MIKYGFKIDDGCIYDLKQEMFKEVRTSVKGNILYEVKKHSYKRLIEFEILLFYYDDETVFEMLRLNKHIQRMRKSYVENDTAVYLNKNVVMNFPPRQLYKRDFQLYKRIKDIEKKIIWQR